MFNSLSAFDSSWINSVIIVTLVCVRLSLVSSCNSFQIRLPLRND